MISPVLDVRRLQYFLAVAETLHFRKAAERLHVAQPALSQQIRRLEEDLGCQLLTRNRRGVALTPAGQALLESGRRALVQLTHAEDAARRTAANQVALLRIGFLNPAAFAVVPPLVLRLRAERPDVFLALREGASAQLLEEVRLGQLDVAFVRGPVTHPGVRIDVLRREPLIAVLPAKHPLARRKRVPLAELADEPFIGFRRDAAPSLHDAITRLCMDAGFAPAFVTEASEWYTIVSLVAAGLGVAILPESIAAFSHRDAVYRPIAGPCREVELVMAQGPGKPGAALEACLRIVGELAESL
ncbi:MAG TPA: LysR family transcriptional regulator [Thermoanaerobaculia bacterium]